MRYLGVGDAKGDWTDCLYLSSSGEYPSEAVSSEVDFFPVRV